MRELIYGFKVGNDDGINAREQPPNAEGSNNDQSETYHL